MYFFYALSKDDICRGMSVYIFAGTYTVCYVYLSLVKIVYHKETFVFLLKVLQLDTFDFRYYPFS